jgi:hypothetical protein
VCVCVCFGNIIRMNLIIYFPLISLNVFLCSGIIAVNTVMVQTRLGGIHIRKSTFLSIHFFLQTKSLKKEIPLKKYSHEYYTYRHYSNFLSYRKVFF